MRNFYICLLFLSLGNFAFSQSYINEIIEFQKEMNSEYADSIKSPLLASDRMKFSELSFFPVDSNYKFIAKFIRTPYELPFPMKTTTSRAPLYVKYGEAVFVLNNDSCKLNIYQNINLIEKQGFEDYLFLPFTDLTNGNESYGGGRYIDLKKPDSETIVIDFNKAYNPYCAYNSKYSCPIPPAENFINHEIRAGVKKFH